MNARLQQLRETLRMEWGELASHLGISRSMLDFVRKGQRNLSFPALRRLEEAERAAGILPPPKPESPDIAVPKPPAESAAKNVKNPKPGGDPLREIAWLLREAANRMDAYLEERDGKL